MKMGHRQKQRAVVCNPRRYEVFRETTLNKVVVMGSNTLKSFPSGKPLKNRVNIVLWPDADERDDVVIVRNLDELSKTLSAYDTDDVFIIGGAMFYKTMLPYCDTAYITKVRADGQAQVFLKTLTTFPAGRLKKNRNS